ncbi:MAG: transposase, partial [Desulfuromonadales bacterium]
MKRYDADIHHRQSLRLREFDYAREGAYFVTVCAQGRECLFGEVVDGEMVLNDAGRMIEEVWDALPDRYPGIEIDVHMVMPDHFHGIIWIHDVGALLAAPRNSSITTRQPAMMDHGDDTIQGAASSAPTLGMVMRAFKSISAIAVNRLFDRTGQPLWQRNYFERIIRDDDELRQQQE